jgi:hypothetical protein
MLGQFAFALYLSLHAVSKFYFIWFPIFPIVVLRGHISPRLCSWSQCEGTRKTLRQAYRGSLSLYLGFMLTSLCFTSFYRIYNPLVPQTRFSPLSLQFSSLSDPSFYAEVTGSKVGWFVVFWVFEWSPSPTVPGEVKLNTWLFMLLLSRQSLQRPGIYCQFLVMVHVVDMLIGNWVSYPSNGLKRGKISMVGRFHGSLHLPKKVYCTRIYCLLKARIQALSMCGW